MSELSLPSERQLGSRRVLYIPELLNTIFEFLYYRWANATSAALVCRLWSDIALDCVWRSVPSLMPLLRVLAPLATGDDDRLVHFPNPAVQSARVLISFADLGLQTNPHGSYLEVILHLCPIRFLRYEWRAHYCYRGVELRLRKLSPELISILGDGLRYSPSGGLLPNIRECTWELGTMAQSTDAIPIFLSQTNNLKHLHIGIHIDIKPSNRDTSLPLDDTTHLLAQLSADPPFRLSSFSVSEYSSSLVPEVVKFLHNQQALSQLTLESFGFAKEFGDAFESLVNLQVLRLNISSHDFSPLAMALEEVSRTKQLRKLYFKAFLRSFTTPTTFDVIRPLFRCSTLETMDIFIPLAESDSFHITPNNFQSMASAWPLLTNLALGTFYPFSFSNLVHLARVLGH
ncbi:hypothetical protein FRB99_005922 [Tulasnella sp. 403]|nr:hypothetical protein FRB99_005922 [Tulasnella sp. 403]